MIDAFRSVLRGSGPASWVFYLAAGGAAFYFAFPRGGGALAGMLAGALAALRVELNDYRSRVERLEMERGWADAPAPTSAPYNSPLQADPQR